MQDMNNTMHNRLEIQQLYPAYVTKILTEQPCGTYILRHRTNNDDVITLIQNKKEEQDVYHDYIVLSVRVNEKVHKNSILNYRLSINEENPLERYRLEKVKNNSLPSLQRQLIIRSSDFSWNFNTKKLSGLNFTKDHSTGQNNDGISDGSWRIKKQNDIKVFIKRFRKTNYSFNNEFNIVKEILYFPIVTFYGSYSDRHYNYLVFSHGGKSLASICPLQGRTLKSTMYRVVNIGFQIANAMVYLEAKNIVHRDLTASNVLVDDYGYVRITDFGHAIKKEEGINNLSRPLTTSGEHRFQIRFLAPECLPQVNKNRENQLQNIYASFSSKSDVWAFGILLIQLMLKKPSRPYPHITNDMEIPERILLNREMHPKPEICDVDVYYVLQQCWAFEPINRISFRTIREKMNMLATIYR